VVAICLLAFVFFGGQRFSGVSRSLQLLTNHLDLGKLRNCCLDLCHGAVSLPPRRATMPSWRRMQDIDLLEQRASVASRPKCCAGIDTYSAAWRRYASCSEYSFICRGRPIRTG
jgi:hypothetical protein